jgi:hypothetical protein
LWVAEHAAAIENAEVAAKKLLETAHAYWMPSKAAQRSLLSLGDNAFEMAAMKVLTTAYAFAQTWRQKQC